MLKSDFEIPPHIHYLNCSYMAPLHQKVLQAGQQGLLRKRTPWQVKPAHFFEESNLVRESFAKLIHCEPNDVALIPSVSYGIGTAALNLAKPNVQIAVLDEQFPSNVYPWQQMVQAQSGQLHTITKTNNWTEAITAFLEKQRLDILALPICHWTDGGLIDLKSISAQCQQKGIALVLDATQSLGALPFDIKETPCDFLVCAAYKWLFGPYSLAFMYAHPKYQKSGKTLEQNWITRLGSQDFSQLVNYQERLEPSAERFDVGERSNFILLPMARQALNLLLEFGVDEIQKNISSKTDWLAHETATIGFQLNKKEDRAGHMIGLRSPNAIGPGFSEFLAERDIFVSVRGTSIRVSPHVYNTQDDLEALVQALQDWQEK